MNTAIVPRHAWLAGALSAVLMVGCSAESAAPPAPRPVITQTVARVAENAADRYTGAIRAHHETALSFRTGGKIVERRVELGDQVKEGQLLARLDAADAHLNEQAAQAAVKAAEARRELARRELQRIRDLQAHDVASQSQLDARRNDFAVAEAQLKQSRNQYALAQRQQSYTELRADRDGVITGVEAETGQVVSPGQPVFRMAGDGRRELVVDVPESRIDVLRHAQQVGVTLWALPGKSYSGTVSEIAADADPASRTFQVKIAIPDAGSEIRLGMSATAEIADGGAPVVKIPLTSLYHADDAPAVWVVDPTTSSVQLRKVTVERYLSDGVIVSAGLQPGDVVVVRGVHKLHTDEVVAPVAAGDA